MAGTPLRAFVTLLFALLLPGCAAYQLGDPSEPLVRAVRLEPVQDRAAVPQIRGLLARDLATSLVRGGQVTLDDDAGAVLEVVIVRWNTRERTTRVDDTGRAFSVDATLGAEVTLTAADGTRWLDQTFVTAETTLFAEPSLSAAEFQAMPPLSAELAARIAQLVTNPW